MSFQGAPNQGGGFVAEVNSGHHSLFPLFCGLPHGSRTGPCCGYSCPLSLLRPRIPRTIAPSRADRRRWPQLEHSEPSCSAGTSRQRPSGARTPGQGFLPGNIDVGACTSHRSDAREAAFRGRSSKAHSSGKARSSRCPRRGSVRNLQAGHRLVAWRAYDRLRHAGGEAVRSLEARHGPFPSRRSPAFPRHLGSAIRVLQAASCGPRSTGCATSRATCGSFSDIPIAGQCAAGCLAGIIVEGAAAARSSKSKTPGARVDL